MKRKLAGLIFLVATWQGLCAIGLAQTTIPLSSAAPLTITFTANDPDTPLVAGNSSATITFQTSGGANGNTWNVQVQATTANFSSCPSTVAATKVRVTCASATVANPGTGVCSGAFNLSNVYQTVASGTEKPGANSPYTVVVNFAFTDSWSFIPAASPCAVNLNYRITAN